MFPCTKCGECCRRAGCAFVKDNICTVYDKRPLICQIDVSYKFDKLPMSKDEYYRKTADVCNKWIKESNLDKKYLVRI